MKKRSSVLFVRRKKNACAVVEVDAYSAVSESVAHAVSVAVVNPGDKEYPGIGKVEVES